MGTLRPPRRVNFICGILSSDEDLAARAIQLLKRKIGPIDEVSETWSFDLTEYYEPEMGAELVRRFVGFQHIGDPVELPHMKILTNDLEARIGRDLALPELPRPVNLDPGYITLSKLVLATTKDFNHRIYLREGIYAECTLRYQAGHWQAWPWTYPDYADARYHAFFTRIREHLKAKLSEDRPGPISPEGASL